MAGLAASSIEDPRSNQEHGFDYWDFVHCDQCMTMYIPEGESQPTIPFWMTECGHVLCNSHLCPDRTCPVCPATNIVVSALRKDDSLSPWFRQVPSAMEDLVYSLRFQQESMAKLIRFYQERCRKQRSILTQLQADHYALKELKVSYNAIRLEYDQLRQLQQDDRFNESGKRRRISDSSTAVDTSFQSRMSTASRSNTHSSPRREIVTPAGPSRLSLPTEQPQPMFHTKQFVAGSSQTNASRPTSSRLQQFAYVPPETQGTTYWQGENTATIPNRHRGQPPATPIRQENLPSTSYSQRIMPPPPVPAQRAPFNLSGQVIQQSTHPERQQIRSFHDASQVARNTSMRSTSTSDILGAQKQSQGLFRFGPPATPQTQGFRPANVTNHRTQAVAGSRPPSTVPIGRSTSNREQFVKTVPGTPLLPRSFYPN